jgi:hypothetical protein
LVYKIQWIKMHGETVKLLSSDVQYSSVKNRLDHLIYSVHVVNFRYNEFGNKQWRVFDK